MQLLLRLRAVIMRPVNQETGVASTAGGQMAAHIPLPGFPPREGVEDSGVLPVPMDARDSTSLVRSGGGALVEVPLGRYELLGGSKCLLHAPHLSVLWNIQYH